MTTITPPIIWSTVDVETLGAGHRVRVMVTAVEEAPNGWHVWGYRHGRSSMTKNRVRQTAYPTKYWMPK